MNRSVALAVVLMAVAAAQAGEWRRHVTPPELDLPRDHGAHLDVATEWWYLTANLEDAAGEAIGVQFTIFRAGLDPSPPAPGESPLRARHALAAHLAVARPAEGAFESADRLRRMGDGLAWCSPSDLDAGVEGWTLTRRPDGSLRVEARAVESGLAVDLVYTPLKPLVAHGRGGLSQKGPAPGNASIYLSWTRLEVEGEVTVAGRSRRVSGAGWYDHEWGSSQLGEGVVGWDWLSLRLADGRDLMVYSLRRADGSSDPFSSGSLVGAGGTVRTLTPDEFVLQPLGPSWTSPETGGAYPTAWRVEVASEGLDLEVRAMMDAVEVDGRRSTGVAYWEGPVTVSGTHAGEGYMELAGYAGSLEGRF